MFTSPSPPPAVPTTNARPRGSMVYATKEGSTIRTLPYEPARTASPMDDVEFRGRWLECLTNSKNGRLYLHPDLVLSADSLANPPLVYTWRPEPDSDPTGSFTSLAVLNARTRRMQPLPGIPWRVKLRERYLLAHQVAGDNSVEALTPFVDAIRKLLRSGETDSVFFDDLEVDSVLWKLLAQLKDDPQVAVFYLSRPQGRWLLRLPEKPNEYWQRFSRKHRASFRRELKRLSHECRCYREPSEVGAFLEKAEEVSRNTWQTRFLGLRVSAEPEQRQRWERIAELGGMRSYILEHEGKPVAFGLNLQWNGNFLGLETGYDQAYARFSPGKVLLLRTLEDLIAKDTPLKIDLGGGDYEYKQMFCNEQTFSGRVLLVRRAMKPLLAARLRYLVQTITEFARSAMHRSETLTRLVRKWRHRRLF